MPAPVFRSESSESPPRRLSVIEEYLARKDQHDQERDATVDRVTKDLDHRVAKLEAWKIEVLVFVGATKIKWSVVSFFTAILSAVLVVALTKLFHL